MKCGVAIPHYGRASQPSMVEDLAREVEALGFDSVWASDHVLLPVEGAGVPHYFYDALIVMAAAAVTTRLRIGTSVLVIPYRDPRLLASMLATLDQISKGRVILGAGSGGLEGEFAGLGIDFHQRGALTNEYLDCMQALWTTDPTSFHGRWIHFDEMRSNPKPFQNPLPIWIGGHSDAAIQRAPFVAWAGSLPTCDWTTSVCAPRPTATPAWRRDDSPVPSVYAASRAVRCKPPTGASHCDRGTSPTCACAVTPVASSSASSASLRPKSPPRIS